MTPDGQIRPSGNVELVALARQSIERAGAELVVDQAEVGRVLGRSVRAPGKVLERMAA